jgi:hypothetical protein
MKRNPKVLVTYMDPIRVKRGGGFFNGPYVCRSNDRILPSLVVGHNRLVKKVGIPTREK